MVLSVAKLSSELSNLQAVQTEVEAINNFATAFENYFYDSSVLGIPATPGSLAGATTAMKGALVGMSTAASTVIQAAIVAFWGVVTGSAAVIWVTAPLIASATPPPGLSLIKASLDAMFLINTQLKNDLATSANEVATALHPLQIGGIAAITPPPPGVTAPIL